MRKAIALLLPLLLLSGCSLGRTIDTSGDYNSDLKDGTYRASSLHYDRFGFKKRIEISVVDGLISEVAYVETDRSGASRAALNGQKWADCEYNYNQIITQLDSLALVTQNRRFDAVAGATKTCEDYRILLDSVVEQAKKGPEEIVIDRFNDSYQSTNTPYGAMQERITAVFEEGNLKDVTVEELGQAPTTVTRAYSTLTGLSKARGDLSPVEDAQIDPVIVSRYNDLLSSVNNLR